MAKDGFNRGEFSVMMFETATLDMAAINFPSNEEIDVLHGPALRRTVEAGISGVAAATGRPAEKVQSKLAKSTGVKVLQAADDDDLRECLHTLRVWLNDPSSNKPPVHRPRVQRPEGIGQLPVPRTVKQASTDGSCGLCADPIKSGDLVGRTRDPKDSRLHVPMGWLCQHCLYERRHKPRRRDVLLRIFHHLFAGSAVDLNAYECGVLFTWLTEEPGLVSSESWQKDPLDSTLARLRTSQEEGKAGTWIAVPTACTIVGVLRAAEAPATVSPADSALLDAIAQHFEEWATNPEGVESRRYGSGPAFRAQVLAVTTHPTVLSERGGPFDLHHASPVNEQNCMQGVAEEE
ncbi:hypothetical protein [Streptomyces sp. Isolate_45]|uniref:hypothetical protein n=1 Tax=Streptomyces sp. Isolate_45 TaxID=2950111 RepID=UPI0024821048|nr:hypothetical protein [Streptomyces sp. Isolate_45]MDA5279920.1 hypothetical protein [Streptomyces sp. Isolate_45]